MPITIPTIKYCPVTLQTQGLIEIEPEIIGMLAGAVKDNDEWLIVLLGTKSQGGLHIIVDDLFVPPTQYRDHTECKIYRGNSPTEEEKLPDSILPKIVGALHSHHSMGAKFSGGDRADDGLCSTFPMSIVISSNINEIDGESCFLGFNYEAEGRFDLPCGSLGACEYKIIPRGVKDWPSLWEVERPKVEGDYKNLGDCSNYQKSPDSTKYSYRRSAKCGLKEEEFILRSNIFGSDGSPILKELPPPVQYIHTTEDSNRNWWRHKGGGRKSPRTRDDRDMDRWMGVDDYLGGYWK